MERTLRVGPRALVRREHTVLRPAPCSTLHTAEALSSGPGVLKAAPRTISMHQDAVGAQGIPTWGSGAGFVLELEGGWALDKCPGGQAGAQPQGRRRQDPQLRKTTWACRGCRTGTPEVFVCEEGVSREAGFLMREGVL